MAPVPPARRLLARAGTARAPQALHVLAAARAIRAGGVVAYPTEAVFGLGCLPHSEASLARIVAIKRRSASKGMILIGACIEQLLPYIHAPGSEVAARIACREPPVTTWVVRAAPGLPHLLTGGRRTVAVRLTRHPVAAALCDAAGSALVSTSANRSGTAPLRRALPARLRFGREVDAVVAGACGGDGRPSRIVELCSGRIVRE